MLMPMPGCPGGPRSVGGPAARVAISRSLVPHRLRRPPATRRGRPVPYAIPVRHVRDRPTGMTGHLTEPLDAGDPVLDGATP